MCILFPEDSLDLKTLCNELEKVKHKAHEIGIQLGIDDSKMMQLKEDLPAAMDHWLSGNVSKTPRSWMSVVNALGSQQVGETGLSEAIRRKYCSQQKDSGDDKGMLSSVTDATAHTVSS